MVRTIDNIRAVKQLDKNNMLRLILGLDEQFAEAKKIGKAFNISVSAYMGIKNILFTGLGGSAIGADIIRSYIAGEIKLPVVVNRNYTLPDFVCEDTFVIASSYSGDTEETLSSYKAARDKKARMLAISSGGRLEKLAMDDNVPFIKIPSGIPPRCALGYSFIPLLLALGKLGLIQDKYTDIDESIDVLKELKAGLSPEISSENNSAKKIALDLYGRYPVIYGASDHIDAVVTRWRGQIAENSKQLASSHVFPEMNHNEIVGWDFPPALLPHFTAVFLSDRGDHARVMLRMDITKKILTDKGIRVIDVASSGKGLLSRIVSLIYIGDMASFYMAILNKVDPTPVDRVTYLKKELEKL